MLVTRNSSISGKTHTREISVDPEKLAASAENPERPCVQDVFPEFSPEDREFLLSGITPEEWADVFGEDDDAEF